MQENNLILRIRQRRNLTNNKHGDSSFKVKRNAMVNDELEEKTQQNKSLQANSNMLWIIDSILSKTIGISFSSTNKNADIK